MPTSSSTGTTTRTAIALAFLLVGAGAMAAGMVGPQMKKATNHRDQIASPNRQVVPMVTSQELAIAKDMSTFFQALSSGDLSAFDSAKQLTALYTCKSTSPSCLLQADTILRSSALVTQELINRGHYSDQASFETAFNAWAKSQDTHPNRSIVSFQRAAWTAAAEDAYLAAIQYRDGMSLAEVKQAAASLNKGNQKGMVNMAKPPCDETSSGQSSLFGACGLSGTASSGGKAPAPVDPNPSASLTQGPVAITPTWMLPSSNCYGLDPTKVGGGTMNPTGEGEGSGSGSAPAPKDTGSVDTSPPPSSPDTGISKEVTDAAKGLVSIDMGGGATLKVDKLASGLGGMLIGGGKDLAISIHIDGGTIGAGIKDYGVDNPDPFGKDAEGTMYTISGGLTFIPNPNDGGAISSCRSSFLGAMASCMGATNPSNSSPSNIYCIQGGDSKVGLTGPDTGKSIMCQCGSSGSSSGSGGTTDSCCPEICSVASQSGYDVSENSACANCSMSSSCSQGGMPKGKSLTDMCQQGKAIGEPIYSALCGALDPVPTQQQPTQVFSNQQMDTFIQQDVMNPVITR